MDHQQVWQTCLQRLEGQVSSTDMNMWLRPLQPTGNGEAMVLLAPNSIVVDRVQEHFLERIQDQLARQGLNGTLRIEVGSTETPIPSANKKPTEKGGASQVDKRYKFGCFVEGKSNQLALAAAMQVSEKPGNPSCNPLLLYGGTGLGKTHLLHAIGNSPSETHPQWRVVYRQAEQFLREMLRALRHGGIDEFSNSYRTANTLLIDDIQFFAGKERTQEEFFHTFNSLLEGQHQIVLTCDRYPKEVDGLEARLKSRLGWGLSVAIEPPDFETRVAILLSKAADLDMPFDEEVAYFMAKRIRSNVRDLEGALNTLTANARFKGEAISIDFARETLSDLLTVHERMITIQNIQRIVAEYFQLRVSDLLSRRRSRSIARPRQIAMALAKDLTEHSLPEIGDAFGGRDHTTVLHACRKIAELQKTDGRLKEDYRKLIRALTS